MIKTKMFTPALRAKHYLIKELTILRNATFMLEAASAANVAILEYAQKAKGEAAG